MKKLIATFLGLNDHDSAISVANLGLKEEHPSLAIRRQEAIQRMHSLGRTPTILGGKFTRHNNVLQAHNR